MENDPMADIMVMLVDFKDFVGARFDLVRADIAELTADVAELKAGMVHLKRHMVRIDDRVSTLETSAD